MIQDDFCKKYLNQSIEIISNLDTVAIESIVNELANMKQLGGRLFILGVGGSSANASHAVNDFRKLCNIESYAPTDNVAELTARTNDEGWANTFAAWLNTSKLKSQDAILILSVGGGNKEKQVSMNIVRAIELGREREVTILGIVGRDGGEAKKSAKACCTIPPKYLDQVTPHTEGITSIILHLLVSHPKLKENATKW